MMNKDFLSHFKEQGISLISYSCVDEDEKLRIFFNHLANKSILITNHDKYNNFGSLSHKYMLNDIDESILDILRQHKDQNVFISVPTSEWFITKHKDDKGLMMRSKNLQEIMRKIYNVSYENNLSIILLNHVYHSTVISGTAINNIVGQSSAIYSSSLAILYKDEKFHIYKNRYGNNDVVDINKLKPIFLKYREKKLRRILQ